jgi:hypothetical protein
MPVDQCGQLFGGNRHASLVGSKFHRDDFTNRAFLHEIGGNDQRFSEIEAEYGTPQISRPVAAFVLNRVAKDAYEDGIAFREGIPVRKNFGSHGIVCLQDRHFLRRLFRMKRVNCLRIRQARETSANQSMKLTRANSDWHAPCLFQSQHFIPPGDKARSADNPQDHLPALSRALGTESRRHNDSVFVKGIS